MERAKVSAQASLSKRRMETLIERASILISLLKDEPHIRIIIDQDRFIRFFLSDERYMTIYFNEMYIVCGGIMAEKVLFEQRFDHHMTALTFAAEKVGDFIAHGKFYNDE